MDKKVKDEGTDIQNNAQAQQFHLRSPRTGALLNRLKET